jgi:hypothetical protein
MAMQKLGSPGGLGLVLPVILSLQFVFDVGVRGGADVGDGSARFLYLCCYSSGRRQKFEEGAVRSRPGGIFFDISGDPAFAGGGHTGFVYQPSMKPNWVFSTTASGGLHPLLGVFISGDLGLVLLNGGAGRFPRLGLRT